MAPSRTVIADYALNGQMRSEAHTALTAPLVLHHTRIYKCTMKKFGFNGQMRNKPFSAGSISLDSTFNVRSSIVVQKVFIFFIC